LIQPIIWDVFQILLAIQKVKYTIISITLVHAQLVMLPVHKIHRFVSQLSYVIRIKFTKQLAILVYVLTII